MRVTPEEARERVGLIYSTKLFDGGLFLESVLFGDHEFEWRTCHTGANSLWLRQSHAAPPSSALQHEKVVQNGTKEREPMNGLELFA